MNRILTWVSVNDTQLFHYVNQQLRCRFFDYTLPKLTHLGGARFTITSLLMLLVLSSSTVQLWTLQALLSLSASHVIVHTIKKMYCRERPYKKLQNIFLAASPLKDYSFPSGHTTAAFSVAVVFALHSTILALILLPIAFLIGFSRMYLGLHFPTDCAIGALLGTICSVILVFLF